MLWRWDQGRLDYFQLSEIKKSAKSLLNYEGKSLPRNQDADALREILEENSDRPFAPGNYKVWRNYKRVFGCQMLATDIGGVLRCTDLCKALVKNEIDNDQYIGHFVTNFYYPSPVFDNYDTTSKRLYIACAVIKLLISEYVYNDNQSLSLATIIGSLKNIKADGDEPIEYYKDVKRIELSNTRSLGDEFRQFRELIIFISQLTCLKWRENHLILDVETKNQALKLYATLSPRKLIRKNNQSEELLQLGSGVNGIDFDDIESGGEELFSDEFIEGNRVRVTHMRVERSRKLKDFFFAQQGINHHVCDMCNINTKERYTWIERIVELHHLLPLSSSVKVEKKSTSLKDIVPLCPTCHRATHKYYAKWLKEHNQKDFSSEDEARKIYNEAKNLLIESQK